MVALTYLVLMFLAYKPTLEYDSAWDASRTMMEQEVTYFLTIFGGMTAVLAYIQTPWRQRHTMDDKGNKLFAF